MIDFLYSSFEKKSEFYRYDIAKGKMHKIRYKTKVLMFLACNALSPDDLESRLRLITKK